MIFTGNTRDAEALDSSVELQLEVRVPDETDEVFTHKIVVDVTGQVEHAKFAVERYKRESASYLGGKNPPRRP